MHIKKNAYQRLGIAEYLVYRVLDHAENWYSLHNGRYAEIAPDERGVMRGGIFPGLWLSPAELVSGDLAALFSLIDEGVDSPEHQALCRRLTTTK